MKPLQVEAVHSTKGAHIHKGAAQRQNHRVKVFSDLVCNDTLVSSSPFPIEIHFRRQIVQMLT